MGRASWALLLSLSTPACVFVDARNSGATPAMSLEPLAAPRRTPQGERLRLLVPASLKTVPRAESQDINVLIKQHQQGVLECWNQVPSAQIKGTEKFTLEFGISQAGKVVNPVIKSDRARPSAVLLQCLHSQVRVWKFPNRQEQGTLLVTHTFKYSAGS